MNKKTFTLVAMLLYCATMFSQNKKVKNYFDYIHQAENFIVESNYKKALKYYKKAFKTPEISFNLDYQNALLCGCKLNDEEIIKKYFLILKQRNFNINKLKKYCLETISEDIWNSLDKKEVTPSIDTIYENELKEVLKKDQAIRIFISNAGGNYETHGDTAAYVDSLNIEYLKHLIQTKGFPTEYMVGNNYGLYLSVRHNQQWKNKTLDKLLYKQTLLGNFSPYKYAFLYDYWTNNFERNRETYRIENANIIGDTLYFDYWTKNEVQIDSLRKILFIESMELQRYKIASNKHKEGFRFHCTYLAYYNGIDEVTKAELINIFEDSRIKHENSKKNDTNNKRNSRKKHR